MEKDDPSDLAGSGKTFFMSRTTDVLHKLNWEINQLAAPSALDWIERGYIVLNAAATAWHAKDWAYAELKANPGAMKLAQQRLGCFTDAKAFGRNLAGNCLELHICMQLATALKHSFVAQQADPAVRTAYLRRAAGKDGTETDAPAILYGELHMEPIHVLTGAYVFWAHLLDEVGLGAEHEPAPMRGVMANLIHMLESERQPPTGSSD